jgi:hypothetical protein
VNKITDIVIATQLSTCFAAFFTYIAHLIENGSILNANWMWAVYVLMGFAMTFMLVPHIICKDKEHDPFADITITESGHLKAKNNDSNECVF